MVRVVRWIADDEVEVALYDGVTKKEVRKLHIFEGKKLTFVCPDCDGEGTLACDVFDPDSGQYQRGVGETTCHCQLKKEDHE